MRCNWRIHSPSITSAEATADLILISRLTNGLYCVDEDGQLARALVEQPELAVLSWSLLLQREAKLRAESPLFSEARASIIKRLPRSRGRQAVRLAQRFHEQPRPETLAILQSIAQQFGTELLDNPKPMPKPLRARFSDPHHPDDLPYHTALQLSDGEERHLLLTKLQGMRNLLNHWGSSWSIAELGYRIPIGSEYFRADALLQGPHAQQSACRILAPFETLHPAERNLLADLPQAAPPAAPPIVFVPLGPLLGPDEVYLATSPHQIVSLDIH